MIIRHKKDPQYQTADLLFVLIHIFLSPGDQIIQSGTGAFGDAPGDADGQRFHTCRRCGATKTEVISADGEVILLRGQCGENVFFKLTGEGLLEIKTPLVDDDVGVAASIRIVNPQNFSQKDFVDAKTAAAPAGNHLQQH